MSTPTDFFHFNDCRTNLEQPELDVTLLPATHWFWQTGNRWVAVADEDYQSWWTGEVTEEVFNLFLRRSIEDVPTAGSLVFWNAESLEFEVPADKYHRAVANR